MQRPAARSARWDRRPIAESDPVSPLDTGGHDNRDRTTKAEKWAASDDVMSAD